MVTVKDAERINQIVELVRKCLAPHQPTDGSYTLDVLPDGIQQDDDWYYVVVQPSREDVRSYDYNARLIEAEKDLQEKEGMNVLLVPALPDEES